MRITVTIPVGEEGGVAGSLQNLPLEEWKDTRILVVDDDPKMLGYVRRMKQRKAVALGRGL